MKKRWPRATAPAATVWDNKKQRDASQASRLSASKKYDLDCLHWEQVVKNLSESPEGVFRQSERDASRASRFLPLGKEKIDSRGKL